ILFFNRLSGCLFNFIGRVARVLPLEIPHSLFTLLRGAPVTFAFFFKSRRSRTATPHFSLLASNFLLSAYDFKSSAEGGHRNS
ncbi:MAG: hypothetical protein J6S92_13895, partial [Oscillospiraceae bacterium]|nr:hypothetical protein [Oscillospiraceae bacterium]